MKIKPAVYENLTAPQRLIATFEALGRNDEAEVRMLFQSCPKQTYSMPEPSFRSSYERILDMALSIEYELLNLAFKTMVLHRGDHEVAMGYLKRMGDLNAVWEAYLSEKGISNGIRNILPRNPMVVSLLEDLPSQNPDTLSMCLVGFKESMQAC